MKRICLSKNFISFTAPYAAATAGVASAADVTAAC
jgi:hypothetical protein